MGTAQTTLDNMQVVSEKLTSLNLSETIQNIDDNTARAMQDVSDSMERVQELDVDALNESIGELKESVENFIRVLEDMMECENFLVLSATTKYRDLIEIADVYSEMVAYKLIFTKMDETGAKGNLYNVRMHTGAPIAYITNGQNVPDDIAVFDAQRIVKHLLGGKN